MSAESADNFGLAEGFNVGGFEEGLPYNPGAVQAEADEKARTRWQEIFTHINMDLSGIDSKSGRFANVRSENAAANLNGGAQRTAQAMDALLAQQQQAAYRQAYNNQVSFNIGGRDIKMAQGVLNNFAGRRANDWQQRADKLRREGASAEEIAKAEQNAADYKRIQEITDPDHGPMTEEDRLELQSIFDRNPELAADIASYADLRQQAEINATRIEQIKQAGAVEGLSSEEISVRIQEAMDGMSPEVLAEFEHLEQQREKIGEVPAVEVEVSGLAVSLDLDSIGMPERTVSAARDTEGNVFGNDSLALAFNPTVFPPALPAQPAAVPDNQKLQAGTALPTNIA